MTEINFDLSLNEANTKGKRIGQALYFTPVAIPPKRLARERRELKIKKILKRTKNRFIISVVA